MRLLMWGRRGDLSEIYKLRKVPQSPLSLRPLTRAASRATGPSTPQAWPLCPSLPLPPCLLRSRPRPPNSDFTSPRVPVAGSSFRKVVLVSVPGC